jgi:hypothetical protein
MVPAYLEWGEAHGLDPSVPSLLYGLRTTESDIILGLAEFEPGCASHEWLVTSNMAQP